MNEICCCPFCQGEVPAKVEVCRHCGERIVGKVCQDCLTICPEAAKVCRHCGFRFKSAGKSGKPGLSIDAFEIHAEFWPTFFFRGRLLCETIKVDDEKVVVATPGIFRLWTNEAEIPWNKVAGFDYRSGIFWDAVEIETRGQKPTLIRCLSKKDGTRFREILRSLEK